MAPVVIYDASVLYPSSLQRRLPALDPVKLRRTRHLMGLAVRHWQITGYEPLIDSLALPDADDRHVLAAAIA
jgi:hypothetical protein